MAFTYFPTLPDNLSLVRFLLLDTVETVETPALLTDEQILRFHTLFGVDEGTAKLAEHLMTLYGNEPSSVSVAGISASWGDRFNAWQQAALSARRYGLTANPTTLVRGPKRFHIKTRDPYHYEVKP